jgi:MSHA biogenesis protein MshN
MLNDLDKRSASKPLSGSALRSGVAVVAGRRKGRWAPWAGMFVVLLAGAGVVWFLQSASSPPDVKIAEPASPVPVSTAPEAIVAVSQAPLVAVENGPATLDNLRLVQDADQLQVEMAFSRGPAYRLIRSEQGRQLVLELPDGAMAATLPDTAALPLLQRVAWERGGGSGRLVFTFNQACRYDELTLSEITGGGGQTLRFAVRPDPVEPPSLVLSEAPPVAEPVAGPADGRQKQSLAEVDPPAVQEFVRQKVLPTPRQRAENLCRDGIAALGKGRHREAETVLRAALAEDPGHIQSRDALMHLLTRQERQGEIKGLLAEGVREAPRHLPYRMRFARLLIEEGTLSQAREELLREPRPSLAEAPDLFAMLATVYQREGQFEESARIYRELLAFRPEQAVWWMGLGIALEGTSSMDTARQAYRQALSRDGLSAGLQNYIRQRLAVLGDRGTQAPAVSMKAGREAT